MNLIDKFRAFKFTKWNMVFVASGLLVLLSIFVVFSQIISSLSQNKPTNSPNVKTEELIVNNKPTTPTNTETQNYFDTSFLSVPEGFSINLFARELGKVRAMTFDINGNLYATIIDQGKLVALRDLDNDGRADVTVTLLSGLKSPHGIEIACPENVTGCLLFLAETDKVTRFDLDSNSLTLSNPKVLFELPSDGFHFTRSILLKNIDGNNVILTSVGSSCNVCNETNDKRAKILISDIEGFKTTEFSSGLRNAVFMTMNPENGDVYATENGRDYLGDNVPPDEVNLIEEGNFYGWPYCYGDNIIDRTFDTSRKADDACNSAVTPKIQIQAHSAPLGLRFIRPSIVEQWGEGFKNNLFVAYHGSWNRSEPTGYKVVKFKLNEDGTFSPEEDFITGFLDSNNEVKGRPVDIIFSKEGAMFITDDKEGRIYRVVKN